MTEYFGHVEEVVDSEDTLSVFRTALHSCEQTKHATITSVIHSRPPALDTHFHG